MNYGGNQKPHLLMLLNNREKKFNYIKYIHIGFAADLLS